MDWRRPIDQQKPVSPPPAARGREQQSVDFVGSAEYRAARRDPDHMELAIRARSYREQLIREAGRLI